MSLRHWCVAVALACSATGASAASDEDLREIRKQIEDLKANYETRIQALEQRLKEAEARASAPAPVAASPAAPSPGPGGGSLAAFNPAISAILSGQYANFSQDPEHFRLPGFLTAGDIGPGRRGFSLSESELTFSANVDHKFSGVLTFAISRENSVEVEEAYGLFTGAPAGITPKFGRFLSAQGYLNEQHAHAWDFVDAPLAYDAFFGGQYKTDGVQAKWIAPLEHYVEIGGELGSGESAPGIFRNKNGAGAGVVYARTGGDIGESHSWLAGASLLRTRADDRVSLAIADFVWKYAPNGNSNVTNFKLQGEYLRRTEAGDSRNGWYLQGVYQFMPMWRVGLRYDRLDHDAMETSATKRAAAMIDWSPSEFSRLRLQLAQAKTALGTTDNELFLQYILSLGAHGAHKY